MNSREVLLTAYDTIESTLRAALDGLDPDLLDVRLDASAPHPRANTIGWLAWHLTRVQDDHVADVAGSEQVWTAAGWQQRFDLPLQDPMAIGYGFSAEQVAAVRVPSTDLLLDYHAAVHARTAEFLRGLDDADLDRVVDEDWDPPVTLGVRLSSVVSDDLQHVGQVALLRGLLERR